MTRLTVALFGAVALASAQTDETRGLTFSARLDGTHNELGLILRFDPSVGYRLNRYVAVEAGLPFYAVRPSAAVQPLLGTASSSGIGNAHAALLLAFTSPAVNYAPSLTITAPTGSEAKGLSTGHLTWDWSNLFSRTLGRVTPYGSLGVANTVSDTPFFVRPFTSKGVVGHFEGGALLAITEHVGVGASAYAIAPSGEQTVVSRVVPKGNPDGGATTPPTPPAPAPPSNGHGQGQGRGRMKTPAVWETAPETTGAAEIARDRGGSLWLSVAPRPEVDFHIGYSRSATYALDTVFFGMGLNLGSLLKHTGL